MSQRSLLQFLLEENEHNSVKNNKTTELLTQHFITSIANDPGAVAPVSYTHLRAHETVLDLVCRLLLEKNTTNT